LRQRLAEVEPAAVREDLQALTKARMDSALQFILAGVAKMDRLIDGLLRLSRLGRGALRLESLDMSYLWRDVVAAQEFTIQSAGAEVVAAALPSCFGDATQISQVFANLLDNAVKYRDPARPLRVTVSGVLDAGRAVYCVADNGRGIAEKDRDRIWEIFQRAQADGGIAGEGLGLSLVRRVVERHHGEAWLESTPGEGSRFFVALPVEARKTQQD